MSPLKSNKEATRGKLTGKEDERGDEGKLVVSKQLCDQPQWICCCILHILSLGCQTPLNSLCLYKSVVQLLLFHASFIINSLTFHHLALLLHNLSSVCFLLLIQQTLPCFGAFSIMLICDLLLTFLKLKDLKPVCWTKRERAASSVWNCQHNVGQVAVYWTVNLSHALHYQMSETK